MSSAAEARESICGKFGLKPLSANNILYYYAPLQGVFSYTALSVNVMNPNLILRLLSTFTDALCILIILYVFRLFPRKDITNILLFNSVLGTGLYLYNRPHLKTVSKQQRALYR